MFPFTKTLEKFANFILKDNGTNGENDKKNHTEIIDSRLLATPSIAISECNNLTVKMADIAKESLLSAIETTHEYNEKTVAAILENENMLDLYEDRLGTCLVQISSMKISEDDSQKVSKMLHSIGDFERLGDHAVNILHTAKELHQKKLFFSEEAKAELKVLTDALTEILTLTRAAYASNNVAIATQIEPLEQVIDRLVAKIKDKHITRLQSGGCSIEMGFILSDLLNNYERVSDHCSNIAVSIIELSHNTFDTHKYLNEVKYNNRDFSEVYDQYKLKYHI